MEMELMCKHNVFTKFMEFAVSFATSYKEKQTAFN